MSKFIDSPISEKEEIETVPSHLKPAGHELSPPFRAFSFPKPLNYENRNYGTSSRSTSASPKITPIITGNLTSNESAESLKGYTYGEKNSIRSENSVESFSKSISPPPLTPTRSRSRHRKSYAISVSSPEELYLPQTPKSPTHFIGPNDILSSPNIGSIQYKHELSPKDTINNTNEQIRRNTVGIFGSLSEFAEKNQIDLKGKVFADSNEYETPLIDLEQVYRHQ